MKASILIVDDEPGMREMLRWELESAQFQITSAEHGRAALALVRSTEFDVVISDVKMPHVDGLEVLRATKAHAPGTEVVVITGHADLGAAIACVRGGAFDFLQKPFEVSALVATLERAVARKRLRTTVGLLEASRAIFSNRDPRRLPEVITDLAVPYMDADHVSLMQADGEGNLYVAYSNRPTDDPASRLSPVVADEIAARVQSTREPVIGVDDAKLDGSVCGSAAQQGSVVAYPLVTSERLLGVLIAHRAPGRACFQQPDLERAAIVASQVVLALENAVLFREILASDRLACLGRLSASIAHEMSHPLTHLLGMHDLLCVDLDAIVQLGNQLEEGAPLTALRRAWRDLGGRARVLDFSQRLHELRPSMIRMNEISQDMRTLGQSDSQEPVVMDVNAALRSALRIVRRETNRAALTMRLSTVEELVLAHPGRIAQVFINLLMNAAQALTNARTDDARIELTTERDGDSVVIRVCDNGPGISRERLAHIFEPFVAAKTPTAGSGLGLSISRDIVRDYGGDLNVVSTVDAGTTFTVVLPSAVAVLGSRAPGKASARRTAPRLRGAPTEP